MKKRYYLFAIALLTVSFAHSCPTCVGRMHADSPPFFSDEHYSTANKKTESTAQKKLSWREEIVKQEKQKEKTKNGK